MNKPKLLDLFCCAGGAGMGYYRAGFNVVGVDINPQPNYPFEFHRADALEFVRERGREFDVIHASPPCQHFSTVSGKAKKHHGARHPDLLAPTREALRAADRPYVIENVEAAPLEGPIVLCGSSFGLDLRRHRKFESNVTLTSSGCDHGWQTPRFRSLDGRMVRAGKLASVVGVHGNINYAGEFPLRCRAMGIDWMSNAELVEAIPPAYTEYIGRQLMTHLTGEVAA
jgi:DNA (cytosine-5)-methyltransferase 1